MKINLYLEPQFYLQQEGCATWIYANHLVLNNQMSHMSYKAASGKNKL